MGSLVQKWLFRFLGLAGVLTSVSSLNLHESKILKQERAASQVGFRAKLTIRPAVPTPLWGYFYPAWSDSYLVRTEGLRYLATDPDRRLEKEFRIPADQLERVLFWTAIYSRFGSQMKVLHDRNRPGLVYGYLDFSPLYRRLSPASASRVARQIERDVMGRLQAAVSTVGGASGCSTLSASDSEGLRRVLSLHAVQTASGPELATAIRSQTGQSDIFESALGRSRLLLPHIEAVFAKQGLPRGLTRIPFVESSFNSHAKSKMGAVGLWQFVPRTSRALIHRRDRKKWIDPVHQTAAAARMLKQYRRVLPDWGSAITSFNSGIGRVHRLIQETGADGIVELIDRADESSGLGFAGKNYHAELLAANLVEHYRTYLFSPGTVPILLAHLKADLAFAPGEACWRPEIVPEDETRELSSSPFHERLVLGVNSGRELGDWIRNRVANYLSGVVFD